MAVFGDAREEELRFLVELERDKRFSSAQLGEELSGRPAPRREMLTTLVAEGLVERPFPWRSDWTGSFNAEFQKSREQALSLLYEGNANCEVIITHRGRLRISELRDALRSGRVRESMGILFDGRHVERALRVAAIEATNDSPLTVAFLNLNGMKETNDKLGHDAGDVLIRTYLSGVAAAVEDRGEAFRIGGDEVLVLLPRHGVEEGVRVVRRVHDFLAGERLTHAGTELPHRSLCAGVVLVRGPESPEAVRKRADRAMYIAKAQSRKVKAGQPRPSLLSVEDAAPIDLSKA